MRQQAVKQGQNRPGCFTHSWRYSLGKAYLIESIRILS